MDRYTHKTFNIDKLLSVEAYLHIKNMEEQARLGNALELTTPTGPSINLAIRYGKIDLVQKLLEQRVTPSIDTLKEAIAFRRQDIIELLLERFPELCFAQDDYGTLLHAACLFKSNALVKYFIAKGLDVNGFNARGKTPLHIASSKGYRNIVQTLCQNGANPSIPNSKNFNSINIAYRQNQKPSKDKKYYFDRSKYSDKYTHILDILCQYVRLFLCSCNNPADTNQQKTFKKPEENLAQ